MNIDSQVNMIYKYLKTHKRGITGIEALNHFGCFRLPARIADIKRRYYIDIASVWVEIVDDEDGSKKRVKRYYLEA